MATMCCSIIFYCVNIALMFLASISFADDVSFDNRAIKINGERKLIISGSIHYPRSTPEMWPSLVKKSKEGGLNAIETYIFWNAHEPQRRMYDFSGHLDVVRFLKTIQREGMYAILRIGPYVCAEWTYGGLPVWLHNISNMEMRTNNEAFKKEMENFTTLIVNMMRKENLFASQGGPIILAQIENEYGNIMWGYADGVQYVNWCASLAQSYKLNIPWIMCQQDNAPSPMISTCNGYYCDQWYPKNNSLPKIWTENWSGWYKNFGSQEPHRTAEDLAFAVARFFQLGGSVQNYYMYHGGTNFGATGGGPYISASYDYDAPLDEYGNLNQPKWGHLKQLHLVLRSMEKMLLHGNRLDYDYQNLRSITVFTYQGDRTCFLANVDSNNDFTFVFEGNQFSVPAWSVTILSQCYTEVYNTAKVNAQTSIMVKKPNDADDFEEPFNLNWLWRAEKMVHLDKKGFVKNSTLNATALLDQKIVTNGTTDYMWLLTTVDYNRSDPFWGTEKDVFLHVPTDGHILHAFVNGKLICSHSAENGHYEFTMEKKIMLKPGANELSFLSTTVGLPNYGVHFDMTPVGIHGPVKLIVRSKDGKEEAARDISTNEWVYKRNLLGVEKGLYQSDSHQTNNWYSDNRPANRNFIWYRTTFKAPLGSDPVVVDLLGLGKGAAWVNGFNIGRYWPSYFTSPTGCDAKCDYRGTYEPGKCLTNCGLSSQRWYHIPRSLLKADDNVLVLFEELGGTPDLVSIQTVTVGRVCGHAYEGNTLELSCQGGAVFSEIKFASFGLPDGSCGSFNMGECNAENTLEVVKQTCLGKESCSLSVSEMTFGPLRCRANTYRLAVEAVC